ncbi:MAG: hypothetical protein M3Q98_10425 [Actinomycetota bacterium]|nr:hypothetical protein [Actinomycetota bacterium]
MTSPALTRPPRVTTACLFVGFSCALLLFYVTSTLSDWGSIRVQDQIAEVLADDRLNPSGLKVDDVLGWLRWALLGAAAIAVSGIVFAIYTALGHQASRIILTIMCALGSLVFLAGGLFGILPAAFAIGCGIYLWTPDSRLWFDVKNGKALPPEVAAKPQVDPFATPVPPPMLDRPAETAPQSQPVDAYTRTQRPKSVLGAGLIALIMSSMVAFVCGINAFFYLAAKSEYVRLLSENPLMQDTVREIGMTPTELAQALFIGCAIAAVVALAAIAAAGATLAGNRTGRTLLVILAILTLPISVAAFPVGLMWTAGAIVTLVLLKRPESRLWFARS